LDHMAAMLGDECGRTQAQIEVDKRVAALEDFIEKSGRRNARTTPKPKPKRAAAAPPVGGYDEDDSFLWLGLDDPPYTPIVVPCPTLPSPVSSGRASAVSSGVGASRSSSGSSDYGSTTSVSSGSSWSAGSSPALTATDVKNQVDASFSKWFGQLDNSIDQKVTAAVAKEIKVSDERAEIWMGKMLTAIDNQARQTEKCSVDMAKLMFRMEQLEAGTAGRYDHVDLTVEAASAPSSSSSASSAAPSICVKRSAAIAELGDIETSDTRLARVEAQLDMLISHLSTPQSSSSLSFSPAVSLFQSSPNLFAQPKCDDLAARMRMGMAAYFEEEDRELKEKDREKRRKSILGLPTWK
jgi:hypothetical protein